MTIEYRVPKEDERERIGDVLQSAFGSAPAMRQRFASAARLELYLCAYEDDRVLATSMSHPLLQHFGGNAVPCAGIAAVAVRPDTRGRAVGGELVAELIRRRRAAGDLISALFPATVAVYRKLGYEMGGFFTELSAPLRALPRTGGEDVELSTTRDDSSLREIRECFRRFAPTQSGPLWFEDEGWWRHRVLRISDPDVVPHVVVATGPDGVEGYACYGRGERAGFGIDPACTHLVSRTRRAGAALLGYFGGFHSVGETVTWHGPPNEPLALLLAESRSVTQTFEFRWMSRILDVPRALEARGYPAVDGDCVIAVDDPLFPENAGPFRIESNGGKVTVSPADGPAEGAIPVGLLSALYTGYLSAFDLVRLGAIREDDPAVPVLGRLFAGPPPWSPDFF